MSVKGHPDHATQAEHDAWEGGYEAGMEDGYQAGLSAQVHNHNHNERCDANDCKADRYVDAIHEFKDVTLDGTE